MGFVQDLIELICYEAMNLWVDVYTELGETSFYIEKGLENTLNTATITAMYKTILWFAVSLVVLKVLKKGFWTYILWRDGDADAPIQQTVVNMALAVITAITFPTLYDWFADICLWLLEKTSWAIADIADINVWSRFLGMVFSGATNIVFSILTLIYIICLFVLYLMFIKRSAELFLLRLAFPLSCVGLLDSDGGVFTTTVKALIQTALTTIAQMFFMQLSILIFLNVNGLSLEILYSIACCMAAFATPKMMQNILLPVGGGGGMQKAGNAVHTVSMVKGMFAK